MLETLTATVRVLELGVGQGGAHLRSQKDGEQYYVIDNNDYGSYYDYDTGVDLEFLQGVYPRVRAIKASAEHLPFADKAFSRLEIRFPCGSLLVPGLQAKWRMDPRLKFQLPFLSFLYPLTERSSAKPGWYQEFARVLKDGGELIIWGDHLVDERVIAARSVPYFDLRMVKKLTMAEIRTMGTVCALNMVGDLGKNRVSPIKEIKKITLQRL